MYIEFLPVLSSVIICVMAVYILRLKRKISSDVTDHEALIDSLSQEVQGVSHGAMGVGRKVLVLEKQLEELQSRIEEIQKNDPSKVSYAEASRLVTLGAGVDDLMNSCGISRPEAELVSALTKSQKEHQPPVLTTTI